MDREIYNTFVPDFPISKPSQSKGDESKDAT